jgi:hypothetical protein
VAGKVPTTTDLALGELAVNTADGKIFMKRKDPSTGTETVIDVGNVNITSIPAASVGIVLAFG